MTVPNGGTRGSYVLFTKSSKFMYYDFMAVYYLYRMLFDAVVVLKRNLNVVLRKKVFEKFKNAL